jgi:hypothetical protein
VTFDVQIESWAGSPDRPNEDWAATKDDAVIVLDGAGIPKELPTGCIHSVEWFVQNLGPALLKHTVDRSRSLIEALELAIIEVRELHDHQCDLSNPNSPSATVVVLRLSGNLVETLVLADSTLVVRHTSGEVAAISDDRLQRVEDRLSAEGQPPPSGAAMSEYRNQPNGFWVAGARPEAAAEALTGTWVAESIDTTALLTDGAARYVDLFRAASWDETMQQLADDGPATVLRLVRELEHSDPDRTRWRRSKAQDDATIAYVTH